jgi:hypothetical protein
MAPRCSIFSHPVLTPGGTWVVWISTGPAGASTLAESTRSGRFTSKPCGSIRVSGNRLAISSVYWRSSRTRFVPSTRCSMPSDPWPSSRFQSAALEGVISCSTSTSGRSARTASACRSVRPVQPATFQQMSFIRRPYPAASRRAVPVMRHRNGSATSRGERPSASRHRSSCKPGRARRS